MMPATINTRTVGPLFDLIEKQMGDMARSVSFAIDFETYWMISPVHASIRKEAMRLNTRRGKVLSIGDLRTLGGRYYLTESEKARKILRRSLRKEA